MQKAKGVTAAQVIKQESAVDVDTFLKELEEIKQADELTTEVDVS